VTRGKNGVDDDIVDSLRALLKAGLDLGVAEANRRIALMGDPEDRVRGVDPQRTLREGSWLPLLESVKTDPAGVLQMVKEVWSRGGPKERRAAAHALGHALGRLAPHKSLGLSRELAAMARNEREADLVGSEAIGPILDANPPFLERAKQFLQENEPWIRRAAVAGLIMYVGRKRKVAAATLEVILLLAERHEADIKSAVRFAIKEFSRVDWKGTANVIAEWAAKDPTGGRLRLAKQFAAATAADARQGVEKIVFSSLARIAQAPTARGR